MSSATVAPGDALYVVTAMFNTHRQLIGWHP